MGKKLRYMIAAAVIALFATDALAQDAETVAGVQEPKQLLKLQMSPMKPSRLPMSKKPKLSSMPTKRPRPPKRLLKKNASAPMVATNSFRRGVLVSNMV